MAGDAMSYVTVFEITHEAISLFIPLSFVVFGLLGPNFILLTRELPFIRTVVRLSVFLFACLWVVFVAYTFRSRSRLARAYQSGKYKVVEGPVEHYSWTGKTECFSVRGVEFCHGTANQVGWDPPLRLGPATWPVGITRESLPVRVAYCDEDNFHILLRLEMGRSSR